eukprot:353336-Chlamydomonas_euryale.AAC.11
MRTATQAAPRSTIHTTLCRTCCHTLHCTGRRTRTLMQHFAMKSQNSEDHCPSRGRCGALSITMYSSSSQKPSCTPASEGGGYGKRPSAHLICARSQRGRGGGEGW